MELTATRKGLFKDETGTLFYKDGDDELHKLPVAEEKEMELPAGLVDVDETIRQIALCGSSAEMLVHYVRRPAPKDRIRTVVANLGGKSETVLCLGDPCACLVAISVEELRIAVVREKEEALIPVVAAMPEDAVIIGWSKYCDSAESSDVRADMLLELASKLILKPIDQSERIATFEEAVMENLRRMTVPKEVASFNKDVAIHMALVRALVDETNVVDGIPVSKTTGAPLPRGVAQALPKFVARVSRYYKDKTVLNVIGI